MSSPVQIEALVRVGRRDLVAASQSVWGIESLDVMADPEAPGEFLIHVHFVPNAPGNPKPPLPPRLHAANFRISGPNGGLLVDRMDTETAQPSTVVLHARQRAPGSEPVLLDPVYRLFLTGLPDIDPFLSSAAFSLKGPATAPLDCAPAATPPQETPDQAFIDYLNKDYTGFRRLILDSFSLWDVSWRERNEADTGIVLAEILAYAGDYLSYQQDAAATEAYLGTARLRTSVQRHVRLLDYRLHEGCNSRVWLEFQVSGEATLPAGSKVLSAPQDRGLRQEQSPVDLAVRVFETMHGARLFEAHNHLSIYTWGAGRYLLRRGATSAVLLGHFPHLKAGDALLFEQVIRTKDGRCDPFEQTTGTTRHVVRLSSTPRLGEDSLGASPITEVFWYSEDALPFDLEVHDQMVPEDPIPTFIARGNIVLADFGATQPDYELPRVPHGETYRPEIETRGVTYAVPWSPGTRQSAARTLVQDPREALPAIRLFERTSRGESFEWFARKDLLDCFPGDRVFVVEVDNSGKPFLRFGGDGLGRRPPAGVRFRARFRTGNGPFGSVGPETINSLPGRDSRILSLRNPLAASSAVLPETIDHAKLTAPAAYRTQNRCVTDEDYRQIARRYPEVSDAAVEQRWAGSWLTDFVYILRADGLPADREFLRGVSSFLERYRLLGRYIYAKPPVFVPLDIRLGVDVEPNRDSTTVYESLRSAFSTSGFFNPNLFGFGTPVFLSDIVSTAMSVPGVSRVEPLLFERWGRSHLLGLESGVIQPGPTEVIRVENNPAVPEYGQIDFIMQTVGR